MASFVDAVHAASIQPARRSTTDGLRAGRRSRTSVVIPAKNEATNVGWVLRRLPDSIDEVILVDGRSRDGTAQVARSAYPDVIVVADDARGKGAAMRAGMELARGDVIVLLDADGSMDPQEIDRFVQAGAAADLVKGSRFRRPGGSEDLTLIRALGNYALRAVANRLYRARLTDLCYGFCAVRRDALPVLQLRSDGFEIEAEMTARALRSRLRVVEVPSFEACRRSGQSNLRTFKDGTRVLRTLVVERLRPSPPLRRRTWSRRLVGLLSDALP
jgi:glycosyltransferase involved in cell wall biosynthesis